MEELIIVIPAYEPDDELIKLINKLNNYFEQFRIIVVNDGTKNNEIFESVKALPNVTLLNHEVNMGKGAALKTAFNYIKELEGKFIIVTADSDGQHKPEDIRRVLDFYKKNNEGLVLGSRKFDCKIPARSSFGNNVARGLLRLCNSKYLHDTQTGLRAFNSDLLDFMLSIKGNRYEYEINMLAESIRNNIMINEIAIETIYINNNEGSHFRPVRDFSRICGCIIKYTLSFFITFLLELILFIHFHFIYMALGFNDMANMFFTIISSTFVGLVFNISVNYFGVFFGNEKIFKNKYKFIRYLSLCIILLTLNISLCLLFYELLNSFVLAKLFTELIILVVIICINYLGAYKSKLYEE